MSALIKPQKIASFVPIFIDLPTSAAKPKNRTRLQITKNVSSRRKIALPGNVIPDQYVKKKSYDKFITRNTTVVTSAELIIIK